MNNVILSLLACLSLASSVATLECYNDQMLPIYCSAQTQYCLKADAYNGKVYRGCAYMQDCPQGQDCAPITYSSDGTTDYVCCCVGDRCNSANDNALSFVSVVASLLFATAFRNA